MTINGYQIKWNGFWGKWIVSHDEIGAGLAEFHTLAEAQDYCKRG